MAHRRRLLLFVSAAIAVFLGLAISVADDRGWFAQLDDDVTASVHDAVEDHPAAVDLAEAVTHLGNTKFLCAVVAVVALYALRSRRPALAAIVVVTAISGALLNHVVKEIVGRERPSFADPVEVGHGPAFPSGHAMNSLIAFGAAVLVVWVTHRRSAYFAVVLAAIAVAAIGVSRVTLGVHYVSDVVGGWLLGIAWLALGATFSLSSTFDAATRELPDAGAHDVVTHTRHPVRTDRGERGCEGGGTPNLFGVTRCDDTPETRLAAGLQRGLAAEGLRVSDRLCRRR